MGLILGQAIDSHIESSGPIIFFSVTYMWVPVQVSSWRSQFKVQVSSSEFKSKICTEIGSTQLENYKFSKQTHHEPHSCKKTQTEINSAETRRTKFNRNDPYLKRRIVNDKYDNIFHVHNHNQEYCATPMTCNYTTNTSTMYSLLFWTLNFAHMVIKQSTLAYIILRKIFRYQNVLLWNICMSVMAWITGGWH